MDTTILPKSTRRQEKLDKFLFGTPWLPDLLWKHWFASSVWNFCSWVADVPPREMSTAAKSEEKRMFSQARGRKNCWWPLKSHSRLSYLDRVKKNITHISLSTFGKIFVQTFFLSLNILVKQTLPLPPTPIFSKALLYWRLNIPESIWKRLSVSAFMKY